MRDRLYPSKAFNALFLASELAGGSVRLHRHPGTWGLHVVLGESDDPTRLRGAAFTFPDVRELEWHASLLTPWIDEMFIGGSSESAGNTS